MFRVIPATIRRPLTAALALLVAAALSHCAWEEGRELALRSQAVAGQRLQLTAPLQAPAHDCSHEAGCICRGATVAAAMDVGHFAPAAVEQPPLDLNPATVAQVENDHADRLGRSDDSARSGPVISGRQLRALYASLVI